MRFENVYVLAADGSTVGSAEGTKRDVASALVDHVVGLRRASSEAVSRR